MGHRAHPGGPRRQRHLLGLTLGLAVDRRWLAFLLQHAVQCRCPQVPVFRRLGVRTAGEIDQERYALKALRGDFDRITSDGAGHARARARHALDAVRATAR